MEGKTDLMNSSLANVSILYPLKTTENKNGLNTYKHPLESSTYIELPH